jgi:alkylation response protein AidB-like acyl-CoA dehydrogenase
MRRSATRASKGAWSATRYAALLCDAQPAPSAAEPGLAVGVAKSAPSAAAVFATAENIQIHGGIGFTCEHPAHLRFRRARSAAILLRSSTDHRRRTAALLFGANSDGTG